MEERRKLVMVLVSHFVPVVSLLPLLARRVNVGRVHVVERFWRIVLLDDLERRQIFNYNAAQSLHHRFHAVRVVRPVVSRRRPGPT
jgi:hypothetical protein